MVMTKRFARRATPVALLVGGLADRRERGVRRDPTGPGTGRSDTACRRAVRIDPTRRPERR